MISRRDAFGTWLKIGLLSFGGPAGQIALMHKILVEEKNWISETRFLQALNYCMLLPGPEAMQLATYCGWLLHRTWGGVVAGLLFILPGLTLIILLSGVYAAFHDVPAVGALFFGLKSAVLVLVVEAVIRIGKRSLHSLALKFVAVTAFIAIFFLDISFPFLVVATGLIGMLCNDLRPGIFGAPLAKPEKEGRGKSVIDKMLDDGALEHTKPDRRRTWITILFWLFLWLGPVIGCMAVLGEGHIFSLIGIFFSKMAVVTFGGAYAALSFVAQRAVEHYYWLTPDDMLNGLGLAETTPGPLVLVLQYVGYMAAFGKAVTLHPHVAGVLGAAFSAWVTFAPCFLWIFAGAPYIQQIRHNETLAASLSAITAAVTGVILNLAAWFSLHVLFNKVAVSSWHGITTYEVSGPVLPAAAITLVAAFVTFRLKWGILRTLGLCALLGLAVKLV